MGDELRRQAVIAMLASAAGSLVGCLVHALLFGQPLFGCR